MKLNKYWYYDDHDEEKYQKAIADGDWWLAEFHKPYVPLHIDTARMDRDARQKELEDKYFGEDKYSDLLIKADLYEASVNRHEKSGVLSESALKYGLIGWI